MSLWSDVLSTQIVSFSQWGLILSIGVLVIRSAQIKSGRTLSFANFPKNIRYYDVPVQSRLTYILYGLITIQTLVLFLSVLSGAYLYSLLYLANIGVFTILILNTYRAANGNRNLTYYESQYGQILKLSEFLPKQQEQLQTMQKELQSFELLVEERKKVFKPYLKGDFLPDSLKHYESLKSIYQDVLSENLELKLRKLKEEFERGVKAYVAGNPNVSLSPIESTLPNQKGFNNLLNKNIEVLNNDTKNLAPILFQDFSKYDEKEIINIIDLATKYRFTVTSNEIDRILERVKALPSKAELLNRLYSSNAITAPIIIYYLEQDQDWIITPQMYDILKPGELSNVLSLLVEKNLLQSTRKFLQQLPALKLQILYRITREVKNPTSELILEFRSFLPLRFMFSDPSTMYFDMYNALVDSGNRIGIGLSSAGLSEAIIRNKDLIMNTYQNKYEETSALRRSFEAIKLDLLSSNLRQSTMIRLETAMELFYQYAVNLKQKEATVLFQLLEGCFLIEETDRIKVEHFLANQGHLVSSGNSIVKHNESGISKLKRLLKTEPALIKQIMSRIEQQRQSYDRLLEWVK
jgi:hypothetical protein